MTLAPIIPPSCTRGVCVALERDPEAESNSLELRQRATLSNNSTQVSRTSRSLSYRTTSREVKLEADMPSRSGLSSIKPRKKKSCNLLLKMLLFTMQLQLPFEPRFTGAKLLLLSQPVQVQVIILRKLSVILRKLSVILRKPVRVEFLPASRVSVVSSTYIQRISDSSRFVWRGEVKECRGTEGTEGRRGSARVGEESAMLLSLTVTLLRNGTISLRSRRGNETKGMALGSLSLV